MIKLHPFQDRDLLSFDTLTLSIFPVGWFYNFLYYTDSGSTFFVLWSYLLSIEERYWMSALVSDFLYISYLSCSSRRGSLSKNILYKF
jgi:hypothetical protein